MPWGSAGVFRKLALRDALEKRLWLVILIFALLFLLVFLLPSSEKARRRQERKLAQARGHTEAKREPLAGLGLPGKTKSGRR
mmetsp:Transcript_44872/g.97634  ORF Transcript_44872/g.97634 Transcript_44872/m.97634 type:complete len:82 (+) Transcript_44872:41-286(+)